MEFSELLILLSTLVCGLSTHMVNDTLRNGTYREGSIYYEIALEVLYLYFTVIYIMCIGSYYFYAKATTVLEVPELSTFI